jgi:hypothetical protein
MGDFSLHAVRSRPAKVGDKLITRMFNLGTTGFCAPEDEGMAVCLLPGTEVSAPYRGQSHSLKYSLRSKEVQLS